jgi:hypothetical protein
LDYYDYSWLGGWGILIWILAIGANVGLAFIPATIARNKGYSFGGFWCISFFASFLVGLIIALCLTDKRLQQPYQQPQYGQPYQQPYQPPVPPPQYQQPYAPPYVQNTQTIICPNCKNGVPGDSAFCARCGAKLR